MLGLGYEVEYFSSANDRLDALVIVGEDLEEEHYPDFIQPYLTTIRNLAELDAGAKSEVCVLAANDQQIKRLIWSPTGPTNRDYDDVRRYKDAAIKGVKRACKAGSASPGIVVYSSPKQRESKKYKDSILVTLLGAMEAVYVPIEVREALPEKEKKVSRLGVAYRAPEINSATLVETACSIEFGRLMARDIGGSDPERMSAANTAKYVTEIFKGTSVKVKVIEDREVFEKEYPLFAAVDRCATEVDRHAGRIIELEYNGDNVNNTYMFVGKGVTYDTGGADVKAGGVMAGMHRDKCGAATVAGIFGMLEKFKPKGIKVVGRMAMVRNSIGKDCYVADEIITSAAGVRVRVGNTDAEGRMAMTDPLYHTKQQALDEVNPHLFTIATLTGHAVIAVGVEYTCVMDNGPAEEVDMARSLQKIGDGLSNPFEVSTIRREDYKFCAGRNEYEDLIQCNNQPSSRTPRGHQFPAAFMISASGLSRHGIDSDRPLKYTHFDIAGSSGDYPGIPTGAPLIALGKLMNLF